MMCPDCGCDLKGYESSCPNCAHIFFKTHVPEPKSPQEQQNDLLRKNNELLKEQNELLRGLTELEKANTAYTMLNAFWH